VRSAIKRNQGKRLSPAEWIDLAFDERLVFAKIRERFGGRLKYAISASATLGRDVAEFIDALGLTVYEGYGLTETSPIVSANVPGHRRFGSVGYVLPGVRVAIDHSVSANPAHGEIIVYGPNVMVGYHNRPEENQKALLPDGGLRTGDLGYLDDDGFLYITGRIKEQYKLENGKYVMPSPLEEELKLSPYIANIMIDGDGRPFNVALVVIDEAAIREWADEEGARLADPLVSEPRVRELIRNEIAAHACGFREFEKPRDFVLIDEDFTPQNGLLTPTLKLKRREVRSRYGALLDALYTPQPPAELLR
jgi:long-chain acyl-CoA synthetase